MTGRGGRGQAGQVLPWAAGGLVVAALAALLVARVAHDRWERVRWQTAADATALSSATSYARGLNLAAASNQILLAAAITDLALKALGVGAVQKAAGKAAGAMGLKGPTSFTDVVTQLQDLWAGTWLRVPPGGVPAAPAGFAPLMMEATAVAVGRANGLWVVPLWNGRRGPGAAVPDLNLRRATATDVMAELARTGTTAAAGTKKETRYSYQPEAGGARVEVPPQEVERSRYKDEAGRWVERSRIKGREGNLAGKFLHVEKLATKALKALDFPLPLVERDPAHRVVVVGRPCNGNAPGARRVVVAAAEVGGGEVFNAAFGDPSYDVRLVEAPGGMAADADVLRLLASPGLLRDWIVRSAATMVADYFRAGVCDKLTAGLPGLGPR